MTYQEFFTYEHADEVDLECGYMVWKLSGVVRGINPDSCNITSDQEILARPHSAGCEVLVNPFTKFATCSVFQRILNAEHRLDHLETINVADPLSFDFETMKFTLKYVLDEPLQVDPDGNFAFWYTKPFEKREREDGHYELYLMLRDTEGLKIDGVGNLYLDIAKGLKWDTTAANKLEVKLSTITKEITDLTVNPQPYTVPANITQVLGDGVFTGFDFTWGDDGYLRAFANGAPQTPGNEFAVVHLPLVKTIDDGDYYRYSEHPVAWYQTNVPDQYAALISGGVMITDDNPDDPGVPYFSQYIEFLGTDSSGNTVYIEIPAQDLVHEEWYHDTADTKWRFLQDKHQDKETRVFGTSAFHHTIDDVLGAPVDLTTVPVGYRYLTNPEWEIHEVVLNDDTGEKLDYTVCTLQEGEWIFHTKNSDLYGTPLVYKFINGGLELRDYDLDKTSQSQFYIENDTLKRSSPAVIEVDGSSSTIAIDLDVEPSKQRKYLVTLTGTGNKTLTITGTNNLQPFEVIFWRQSGSGTVTFPSNSRVNNGYLPPVTVTANNFSVYDLCYLSTPNVYLVFPVGNELRSII
jgi:hypothetical protein